MKRVIAALLLCVASACSSTNSSLSTSSAAVEGELVDDAAAMDSEPVVASLDEDADLTMSSHQDSESMLLAEGEGDATQDTSEVAMALPTPESLIGMKSQDAKTLVESNGGTYHIYRRYQNQNDQEPVEDMQEEIKNPLKYNVALDRGNIVADCHIW